MGEETDKVFRRPEGILEPFQKYRGSEPCDLVVQGRKDSLIPIETIRYVDFRETRYQINLLNKLFFYNM